MRASAACLQIAANAASPCKKLPACALEFTGRVEIWTPTCYLEDTRLRLDEPHCKPLFQKRCSFSILILRNNALAFKEYVVSLSSK